MQWWWTKLLCIKASWFEKRVSRPGVPKRTQLVGTSPTVQCGFPLQKLYQLMHCNPHTVPASTELRVKWIHYMCLSFFPNNIFSSLIQFQAWFDRKENFLSKFLWIWWKQQPAKEPGPLTASLRSNCSTNSDGLVVTRDSKGKKNALQMKESQKGGNSSTPARKGGRTLCTAGLKALLLWDRSEKGGWKKCKS